MRLGESGHGGEAGLWGETCSQRRQIPDTETQGLGVRHCDRARAGRQRGRGRWKEL